MSTSDGHADGVHGRLRAMLLAGELVAGAPLKEVELSERLGVSRTPLREALHRLEMEGVVAKGGRSYAVAVLDDDVATDIAEARAVLEPAIAGLAADAVRAGAIAPARLDELAATVTALDAAAVDEDGAAAATANHAFHRILADLSGNPVLADMATRLNDRLAIASLARLGSPGWAAAAAVQHRRIADAVAAGDAMAARAAAADHIGEIDRQRSR